MPAEPPCIFLQPVFGKSERGTLKIFLQTFNIFFVFLVLDLPVVPVSIAPVILNTTYSLRMVSSLKIIRFLITHPEGVSYQYHWYAFAVIYVLLAIGCLVSVWAIRKFELSHQ